MFIDEFSQIKEDREVLQRTSDTTGCRIFNGTHLGMGTAFFELSQRPDMKKLQMHWTQHPDKNKGLYQERDGRTEVIDKLFAFPPDFAFVRDGSPTGGPHPGVRSPWYDKECKRKGSSRAVAMDLDIDPKGSVSQVFDALMIHNLKQKCRPPIWEGELHYDKDFGKPISLIRREGGPIKLWMNPVQEETVLRMPYGNFAFGSDVATGSGATPTCLSGGHVSTGEKVFEYRNPFIDPKQFASFAVAICRLFCTHDGEPACLAWEIPGPGKLFGDYVTDEPLSFFNIYFRENAHVFKTEVSDIPGWTNTPQNLQSLMGEYGAALSMRILYNPSRSALDECLNFKYDSTGKIVHAAINSDDPSGARVNHGDTAIADALMWMMMKKGGAGNPIAKKEEEIAEPPPGSLGHRRLIRQERERLQDSWA